MTKENQEKKQKQKRGGGEKKKLMKVSELTKKQILTFESVRRLVEHCFGERAGHMVGLDTEKQILGYVHYVT